MNAALEQFEYVMLKGFFFLLKISPASFIYTICRAFSTLFYITGSRRRKITLFNLNIAFPDLSEKERKKIARASYDHFGQMLAESSMILAGKIKVNDLQKMVDGEQIQKLLDIEENNERGILVITGHLGNFEMLAHYCGLKLKRQSHAVAREGNNRLIDERIVTPLRKSFGNEVIYKEKALPSAARALRRGEHVGLLIDIKARARDGAKIKFFDHDTYAVKSSAYLQIKLGLSVVPMAMVRTAPKQYKLVVGDPVEWTDNGQPREEQIKCLTQLHQAALEKMIRACPEQWFWMHDRWKRPELERVRRKKRRGLKE